MEWEDSPERAAAVEQAERDEYMERIRAEEHEWEVKQEGEPQPNLSAAVQTLEKLVEKWRRESREREAASRDTTWNSELLRLTQAGVLGRAADELSEALSTLRQREDTTP